MPIPPQVVKCLKYIDTQRKRYVEELRKIVAIPGISSDSKSHKKLSILIEWLEGRLKGLGFQIELREMGTYTPEGTNTTAEIPLLVLGTLGQGGGKKTLLYYCHLDVAEPKRNEAFTDPFELLERDGKLYGCGTARMKGPLLCFIHAIECYKTLGLPVPVNVKIFCESMHEAGSVGVDSSLDAIKSGFSTGIDCILINEGQWIGKDVPCMIHASRGLCCFDVLVEGPKMDLHSGVYGGILYEPMQDVLFVLNALVDNSGRVKIPGFYDNVAGVTPDEEDVYRRLNVDMGDYRRNVGSKKLANDGTAKHTLMNVWRYPSFNLHFIDNHSPCDCDVKLTIPKKVTARFSLRILQREYLDIIVNLDRLVPRQNPEKISKLLYRYVEKELRERCTPNNVTIKGNNHLNPWLEDHSHWNYEAARSATKEVYKEEANLIREGNGMPTLLKLKEALPGKNILVLPMVDNESNAGDESENISLACYIEGTKLMTSYLHHLSVSARKS